MRKFGSQPRFHDGKSVDTARFRLNMVAMLPEPLQMALRAVVVQKRFREMFPFSATDFPTARDSFGDLATLGYLDVNGKRANTKSASCMYRLKPLTVALCAAAGWCELE